MSSISTAIGLQRQSRVSGYQLNPGGFENDFTNLPQIVSLFGEANTANQGTISTNALQITSATQAAQVYGYGSPIHQAARILFPISGDGIGGIPVFAMAQLTPGGSSATTIVWTITGTATANATHQFIVNGRNGIDAQLYSYSVATGDTPTAIATKAVNAINAVLGSPVTAANTAGVITLTTVWAGATSALVNTTVDNGGTAAGVTYAQTSKTAGAGVVDLTATLAQFETVWYTTVINPYIDATTLGILEAFNGVPSVQTPTGQYAGDIFTPFMAFFGSTASTVSALQAITDITARKAQVTNVLCPAPASAGMNWEAAANMVTLFCPVMQNTPQLDVNALSYPDMPIPSNGLIGDMSAYNNRDLLVKSGCSTVTLVNGAYQVQDLVTTYHPAGEVPLQFNYCRNLNLDWNVKDGYSVLENLFVKDKVIVADNQTITATGVIKPKEWKGVLFGYFDDLAEAALINDPAFSKSTLQVQSTPIPNPNRFETSFSYKRTGIARIESTTATAGF
jgi:phage tail sheath gpL-like